MHWDDVSLALTVAKALQFGSKTESSHSPSNSELVSDDRRSMPCTAPQLLSSVASLDQVSSGSVTGQSVSCIFIGDPKHSSILQCLPPVSSQAHPIFSVLENHLSSLIDARPSFLLRVRIKGLAYSYSPIGK